MRKKITLSTLKELSDAISRDDLANYFGGGSGTSYRDPYTFSEYMALGWSFQRGWVQLSADNISYLTENYPSYCGNSAYCCSSYDGSTKYWGSSWYNNSWGYHGTSASPYDSAYLKISELVNQLPADLRARLSNIAFEYNSVMLDVGQYDPQSNVIYLRELNYDALFRECVHAIQKNGGYCGTNHAAKEFQEHVIGDIMSIYRSLNTPLDKTHEPLNMHTVFDFDYESNNEMDWDTWINKCVTKDGLNLSLFLNGVNNYVSDFQESHPNTPGYQGYINHDYDYDWVEMFKIMGIPTY